MPLFAAPFGFFDFVCCHCRFQAPRILGGRQDLQNPCPGNRLSPVVAPENNGKLKPTCVTKAQTLENVLSPESDYVH